MLVNMKHLNRLKVVLVEKRKTGKWLHQRLYGEIPQTDSDVIHRIIDMGLLFNPSRIKMVF